MAPTQDNGATFRQAATAVYATEPKRMRLSTSARASSVSSLTTTRASTGAPPTMTNKGSVYKAQRGRAAVTAAVKAKAPTAHRRRGRKGKSVYRGVCVTREGKWRAVIYKERKQLYLGVYESEVDAAKAHDRAARFHFAENAVCNFDSEHEADRQAVLHKQRQLLEQEQLVDERAHAQLHGGGFSVGREEFDDLDEYHRGLDEAGGGSSEDDDGDVDDCADGYEVVCSRSTRSMSSSSSSMSTGSMSDDYNSQQQQQPRREQAAAGADGGAADGYEAALYARTQQPQKQEQPQAPPDVALGGVVGDGIAGVQYKHQPSRGRCSSSGMSSCESDSDYAPGVTTTALLRDMEPSPLEGMEGMGFPYADDLLGYEMQSWYCCQDDDDAGSPAAASSAAQVQQQQQQPYVAARCASSSNAEELWGVGTTASAVGANLGWGFGDFAPIYGGTRGSSGSMSSSLSCDDEYIPSALPPLMGMCADS